MVTKDFEAPILNQKCSFCIISIAAAKSKAAIMTVEITIFSSLLWSVVMLRQKYQFVRPEKNTKYARGTITLNLKKKNYEITCRVWNMSCCVYVAYANENNFDFAKCTPSYSSPNTRNPLHVLYVLNHLTIPSDKFTNRLSTKYSTNYTGYTSQLPLVLLEDDV